MWGADDPCDRMPMVWPELKYEPQQADPLGRPRPADAVAFDDGLFNFYRAAIALRRDSPGAAARRRSSSSRPTTRPSSSAFAASDGDETLLVGFNRGDDAVSRGRFRSRRANQSSQVFTASGEVDQRYDRAEGRAKRSSRCRPSMASCCGCRPRSELAGHARSCLASLRLAAASTTFAIGLSGIAGRLRSLAAASAISRTSSRSGTSRGRRSRSCCRTRSRASRRRIRTFASARSTRKPKSCAAAFRRRRSPAAGRS